MTLSRTNQLIADAATSLGATATQLCDEPTDFLLRLSARGRSVIIAKTRSPFLTAVAQTLSNNKIVARHLLRGAGLPVVDSCLVDDSGPEFSPEALLRRWGELVVKPNWGNRAVGVAGPLRDVDTVVAAVDRARALDLDEEALVEPFLPGDNVRVCVVGGRCVAATRIVRPMLAGDGRRTGHDLVAALNGDPRRMDWKRPRPQSLDRIEVDQGLAETFGLYGLSLEDRVPLGMEIELLTEEQETIDVTDDLHPQWAAYAERACAHLGVDVGGVDLRGPMASFTHPDRPTARACILEVNVVPALHVHALPTQGRPRPVFEAFVAYCLGLDGAPPPCPAVGAANT